LPSTPKAYARFCKVGTTLGMFGGRIKHCAAHYLALNIGSADSVWLMSEWGIELRHGMQDSIVWNIGFRYYILLHSRLKTMLVIAFRLTNLCPSLQWK
jgi:hypothetical protein